MSETTATSISASGTSGGTVRASGPYICTTHKTTFVFLKKGATFPNCPNSSSKSGHSASWALVSDGAKAVSADTTAVSD